jgi:amino acid transporter
MHDRWRRHDRIRRVERGEAFTWMIVFALAFFVPQALLFAELGTAFPQEGGPYLWTRLAFGHLAGAVNNFLYWVTNPVWIGGTLAFSAITAIQVFFNHGQNYSTPWFFVITIAFVWLSILAAILSFSVGKWLPTVGAFAASCCWGSSPSQSSCLPPSTGPTG